MSLEPIKPTLNKRSRARTDCEALIEDIVGATDEKDSDELKRLLAITAKTLKWTVTDLHALYQKRLDPTIRNYSAFVRSRTKIFAPKNGQRISH